MDVYWILKFIHVIGASVLFGTGAGIAFFLYAAVRQGDAASIAKTAGLVVRADFIFTAPAVVLQLVSGALLMYVQGYHPMRESWLVISLALFVLVGACWLPVVWIQIKLRDMARAAAKGNSDLPPEFYPKMRLWITLGWPAFSGVLVIFWLMITKPDM